MCLHDSLFSQLILDAGCTHFTILKTTLWIIAVMDIVPEARTHIHANRSGNIDNFFQRNIYTPRKYV